ncbi:L,D-transpeptidase [Rhodoplanes sp. TEM]|uniref:L,D-transpeptidase n=1 Tax=Rhodoplanes tepidamans TaxID=200616 RepID=A0ABT5JJU7_RHOTP|nr:MULTISPECIES: L,D-transpeptidase [Rhodoplanes]MDC7789290.1 L,D-transpeptidase [Rhodoplanes tepidamans]MDC7986552.1 L,D-transpeptidase [Rhodoplanes sp. TEM]MDQ0359092.1 lipoprotein-anchoring transpeptidase ErfK/SrfK [Rhodoplanes tepidamans]
MPRRLPSAAVPAALLCLALLAAAPAPAGPLTPEAIEGATFSDAAPEGFSIAVLKAQILLDRAGFSPGAIDGVPGRNFRGALALFQRGAELDDSGTLDADTFAALAASSDEPVLATYEITRADTAGPFAPEIPEQLEDMARLKRLAYTGPRELLAERFHIDPRLLVLLNPGVSFDVPGARIVVPRVVRQTSAKVVRIAVEKPNRRLLAFDPDGKLVAAFPASIGSDDKPTPSGTYMVRRIARGPVWRYNPRFAFKEVRTNRPFNVAAGPNSPLGLVWIGLTAPSYGIHGTPVPEEVGTSDSHGCVRLTNWDAMALAAMVQKGTTVEFVE